MKNLEKGLIYNKPEPTKFEPLFPEHMIKIGKTIKKYSIFIAFYVGINLLMFEGLKLIRYFDPNYEITYESVQKVSERTFKEKDPEIIKKTIGEMYKATFFLTKPAIKYFEKREKSGKLKPLFKEDKN
ncbi:MAG: hypothetical protein KJ566_00750 [Nanoarchaeota archaeon]|nr:hypothetical protein [Nanoarchaeota archaeon]